MRNERPIRSNRGPCAGMLQIVRFNWPIYAAGAGVCGSSLAGLTVLSLSTPLRWLAWVLIAGSAYWTIASLLASHWIYDRSRIYEWTWIRNTLSGLPRRWANIHAGLDESSSALKQLFPQSEGVILDVFDPAEMTEPSISKARAAVRSALPAQKADFRHLPLARAELEAVFLIFAAHEIRKPASRLIFFRELRRALKPGGVVLLVEHLRDFPNFLAFGPGFAHFQRRSAWLKAADSAALAVEKEFSITPFVRAFLFRKAA
jgi:SAM-dependent methyltransferase